MKDALHFPRLRLFLDAETASIRLASETADEVRATRGRLWRVGLPTGNTPLALYRHWIRLHRAGQLSFAEVESFNLDEYWPAPPGAAFADLMRECLFDHVDMPASRAHFLDGRVRAEGVEAECARYEAAIAADGGLELQILGLGLNGHIAFNEPGASADSRTRRVQLSEDTCARAAASRPEWATCREALSVGIATILDARRITVLAFGAAKAEAVARAIEGEVGAEFPASFLRLHPHVSWMLDTAAAARLRSSPTVE